MAKRNFSMIEYFNRIAADWEPLLAFKGSTQEDFEEWQSHASEKYFELLGDFPEPVDLDPEIIFSIEENGIIRERVIFDSEEHMSVPCVVLRPADMPSNGSGAAMDSLTYEFFGRTAHAAGDPHNGRSALDAVEIMNVAVNFLREHVPANVRMHYVIMDGGKAPNVVPAYARSWYFIRGADRDQVSQVSARVDKCAKAAALATETRMKRTVLTACYNRLANDAIAGALRVFGRVDKETFLDRRKIPADLDHLFQEGHRAFFQIA